MLAIPSALQSKFDEQLQLRESGKLVTAAPLQPAGPSVSSPSTEIKKMSVTPKTINASSPSRLPEMTRPEPAALIDPGSFRAGPETGASWRSEYARLTDEIRIRHYSSKTLRTYRGWVKQFQTFTCSKAPAELSTDDVKAFLTFLAVKRKVSAS
ncbi:MAG: phage integrase N-terminal SAM-like domain-containing protein, partial [Deltaproteobacteria bacterium]|nr:phage integrase N-terminal SAM-like domain-containing protein [Deltaproteobacteria bacterium]